MQKDSRKFLSHMAIYLVARGLPGIIAFGAIPLFTRLLDPDGYGRYSLVLTVVSLLNALLFQWMRLAIVRYLPACKDDPLKLKSTLVTAGFVLMGVVGVVILGLGFLPAASQYRPVLLPCWVMMGVQSLFELCSEFARADLKPWRYMVMQVLRSGCSLALGAGMIVLGWGWWGPLTGTTIGMAIAVLYAYRRDWSGIRLSIDRELLVKILWYGVPISLTVALAMVIGTSDRFLIAWFMGEGAAGQFAAVVDFTSQTLVMLLLIISMPMFPAAVHAYEQHGIEAAQEQMKHNASMLLAVGLPCLAGISVLAPGIANCFLGKEFRGAAVSIMPLIALGSFLAGFKAYHFDTAFQFVHRTVNQVWIVLVAAILNIALNLIAIPRWGINGAALASVTAYLASLVMTVYFGRRLFKLPMPMVALTQVLIAATAMAAALFPFRHHLGKTALLLQIAGGAALYATVLIATDFLGLRQTVLNRLFVRARKTGERSTSPANSAAVSVSVGELVEAQ